MSDFLKVQYYIWVIQFEKNDWANQHSSSYSVIYDLLLLSFHAYYAYHLPNYYVQ